MPLIHVRTFKVRYYECDAFEHLNHTSYLRYMQEAAFDASAAAGYDLARYAAMEHHWLVRETDIEYQRPLRYGDRVQVKTWVVDFRRVRSRRAYEFRLVGAGDLVARAETDWAFLHSGTGRPAPIPPEMVAAFFPEGASETALPRPRFPTPPAPPGGVFRLRRRVEWQDIDAAQHVNNAVYLAYVENCGIRAMAERDWPPVRFHSERVAVVARRQQIEYRQPALLDDELELTSWLYDVEDRTAARHCTINRVSDGALVAQARTLWEWVDAESGRPMLIPPTFRKDMAPNIAG